jgi:uncharacterized membrane protein YeaQ/YmgE (transglycosylase-associated protein family)
MNTTFFYGLILAVSNIVLTLVFFFVGFQTDKIAEGRWFGLIIPLAITIIVTCLGIKAAREEAENKTLSYGKGVGTGVLINLYSGVIGSIYGYIHFTYINPNFRDYVMNLTRQKWAEAHLSDAQMDAMEKGMRFMMSPIMSSLWGLITTVFIGLVVALVAAAFLKREPQPEFKDATPAA